MSKTKTKGKPKPPKLEATGGRFTPAPFQPAVTPEGALEAAAPIIERDRWGRPYLTGPDGKRKAYTRCTTYIDVLSDRSALEKWKVRTALIGVAERPVLAQDARIATGLFRSGGLDEREWKAELNALGEQALDRGGAAVRSEAGTNLHALTEVVDRGLPLPDGLLDRDVADIRAYQAEMARLAIEPLAMEVFVVHDAYGVAGTLDRIVKWNGQLVVADIKTGSIDYDAGKIAMQVSLYANSKRYEPTTGARSELHVSTRTGLVIHLPQGEARCAVYELDLTLGSRGVSLAREVRAWRNDGKRAINMRRPL